MAITSMPLAFEVGDVVFHSDILLFEHIILPEQPQILFV
jgi:hypothetical protein